MEKSDIVGLAKEESTSDLWHKRIGHVTEIWLKIVVEQNLLPGIKGT